MLTGGQTRYPQTPPAKARAKLLLPSASKLSSSAQRSQRKTELDQRLNKPSASLKPKLIPVQKRGSTVKTKSKSGFNLHLPDLKSPTFLQDSLQGITTLQQFCQQCLGYVQQATSMMDQLQGTAKSLHEAGIWQRLVETKGKNLSAGDLTNMLVALMNTPIGGTILKNLSPKDTDPNETSAGDTRSPSARSEPKQLKAPKRRKKTMKKGIQKTPAARRLKQNF
ncbi:MAG: hypothetical protein JWN30_2635 [Bacilli bacterium]|nr:hypothetical protein [Bacilli bacterium]